MESPRGSTRGMLRHTVATLAYRGGKAVANAPPEFAALHAGPTTRTPAAILAHIGDLLDWGLSLARGKEEWHNYHRADIVGGRWASPKRPPAASSTERSP